MSIVMMDMSSYEPEWIEMAATDYGDEVLYAGWIPSLSLQESTVHAPPEPALPADLAMANAALFLDRMYEFQR